MNIIQLQYLIDVDELGSFTEAAKKNHMTVPAISISIGQLEEELGTALFVRSHKGATSTIEGKMVIKHAVSILNEIELMKQNILFAQKKNCGNIMIATTPGMVQTLIKTTLEYRTLYPSMNIEMIEGETNTVLKQVKSGHADIGFVSLPKSFQDSELTWVPIIPDRATLVVNKNSDLVTKEIISSEDIKEETIVLYNDPFIKKVSERLHLEDPSNTIALTTNNVESLFQMVIKGNAITIATDYLVHSLPTYTKDELVMIPISTASTDSQYLGRISRKYKELTAHIEQFTELLLSQLNE
ncbi:MAG TPA: LysR family transcriptional regulator [Ureibacillus sp.]|nr:LysR family transcriptional regulator [Ureibacillus sp.]